jgi:SiaC family regulatory phosphoprotein
MENLIIKGTEQTPEINFNKNGLLVIKGISIPENITDFYIPIIQWMSELEKELPTTIHLVFEIEYINTSSTRVFIDIIKKINAYKELCPDTTISWKYAEDDEDNFDLGKDLEYSTKAVFHFEHI